MASRKRKNVSVDMKIAEHYRKFFLVGAILGVVGIFTDMMILWWVGFILLLMGVSYKRKVKPMNKDRQKRMMVFSLILIVVLVIGIFFLMVTENSLPIDSFEECVSAGYPVMESYPRQCRANDQTFVEQI